MATETRCDLCKNIIDQANKVHGIWMNIAAGSRNLMKSEKRDKHREIDVCDACFKQVFAKYFDL